MTIIAGFSSSRQGSAPLNLATQLARTTGEKIIAAAVVERALPAGVDPIEDEYRGYLAVPGNRVARAGGRPDARRPRHLRDGPPLDLDPQRFDGARGPAQRRSRGGRVVVLGSARQGRPRQCDRAAGAHLGGAGGDRPPRLPVEPRSRPAADGRLRRRRRRGGSHRHRAPSWRSSGGRGCGSRRSPCGRSRCSVARSSAPPRSSSSSSGPAGPRRRRLKQLDEARAEVVDPDVDVVIGTGTEWREAVDDIAWESGDLLLLGSGAAGPWRRCSSARPPRRSCATHPFPS